MVMLWAALAGAAPVVCDPLAAANLLAEARIEERRAPVSHAELIPGLALASVRSGTDLRTAIADLCADGASLSLAAAESWEGPEWSAHTFLLTRSETRGCTLYRRTVAISVAVGVDTAPRYALRSRLPVTRTPVGDCDTAPSWRDERTVAGEDGPVRVILATDLEDGAIAHTEVLVRRASQEGWHEQVLLEPAPARLLDGSDGPIVSLTERHDDKWVVVHGDRTDMPACEPIPGQTVWTWEGASWAPHRGREALALLATRGLWRLAGEDGWFLIMAVEREDEYPEILAQRMRRIQKRSGEPLYMLPSTPFPGLNPGFYVFAPAPWPTEAAAEDARKRWRSWRRAYVKRGWEAPDPCE